MTLISVLTLATAIVAVILLAVLLWRSRAGAASAELLDGLDRLERVLRGEVSAAARDGRDESGRQMLRFSRPCRRT